MLMIPRLGGIKFDDILTHHRDSEKGSGQGQSQGQIKNKNQKSRNRRSVATFTRRYVNRNKAKWSEIRELVRQNHLMREKNYFSQVEYTLSSLDLIKILFTQV